MRHAADNVEPGESKRRVTQSLEARNYHTEVNIQEALLKEKNVAIEELKGAVARQRLDFERQMKEVRSEMEKGGDRLRTVEKGLKESEETREKEREWHVLSLQRAEEENRKRIEGLKIEMERMKLGYEQQIYLLMQEQQEK